jgi:predicted phosphodiesterase
MLDMRIALLSDIHGNSIALDAVLADIENRGGVDAFWVLGDLVALGHDPIGVLQRLSALPNARFVRGNTDRYVVTGDRPPPTFVDVKTNPQLLPVLVELAGTFAWTQGALTAAGWLHWLADLPLELHEVLPDGTRFLGVHAAPGADDGRGIPPDADETELHALLSGCEEGLICAGHTHWPLDWHVNSKHVVNLGSVSNPAPPDLRASYAILSAEESGYRIQQHRVDYDREAVIMTLQLMRHPGADFIIKHMRGQRIPRWLQVAQP